MFQSKSFRIERLIFTAFCFFILALTGCTKKSDEPTSKNETKQSEINEENTQEPTPTLKVVLEKFSLQLFGNESPSYFTVAKQGQKAKTYTLEGTWESNSNIQLAKLADSGDVFVIFQNHEHNHYIYQFFSCANELKKEETLDNGYFPLKLEDKEGKEGKVIKAYDWWDKESGARAIAPELYLVWRSGHFELDRDLMKTLKPSNKEMKEARKSFKLQALSKENRWPPIEFEDFLLTLIYSGSENEAKQFMNQCWPKTRAGKNQFWKELQSKLKESKYFTQIKKLN